MKKKRVLLILTLWSFILFSGFSSLVEKNKEKKLRPIETQDILAWKYFSFAALSNDGQWFAYSIYSRKGFREAVIKQTKGKREFRFKINASGFSFSDDSEWIAFIIRPGREEEKKLRKAKKKVYNKVGLVNLGTGNMTEFKKAKRFAFSGENSAWIVLHLYPPESQEKAKEKWSGSDLILHELSTSTELSIGNVSEFAFDKKGNWLAWIVDAEDRSANGVQFRNMTTGEILSLESSEAVYRKLTWTERGDGLTVLKEKEDERYENKLHSVVGFRNFTAQSLEKIVYDPMEDTNFPEGMTISPTRDPIWTEKLDGILFGIHQIKAKEKRVKEEELEEYEKIPDLILWHWLDKRMQTRQRVEEKADRDFSYLCVFWVDEKRFIRLADEEVREAVPAPKHRWALGFDEREYLYISGMDGREYKDIYVIDMKTGARRLAVRKCRKFIRPRWFCTPSPDGTHFFYYNNIDAHFYAHEMETGWTYNLTKDVPTSFVNEDVSYNQLNPAIRPFGWAKDGKSVLLSDNWDVWKVPVRGGKGVNLTVNGKKEGIRYRRRYVLDFERHYQQVPDEKGVDLSGPVYFEAYGEWTKKAGIARIDKGRPGAKMLIWDDALFYRFFKAKKSDMFFYNWQTFDDWGFYAADSYLQNSQKILGLRPEQKDFLWSSGSILLDYKSKKGDKLQAALFLPANYEKGKRYPTVVQIYEKRSHYLNRYYSPGFTVINKSVYTSRGYAVLTPDIVFELNNQAMSAVLCVLPAIEAAVAAGEVDRDRIGITGHSWGGYETAFLITQTDIFKAAVAGAPLTNMISMYNSVYERTGDMNSRWFESSQDRFKGGHWLYFDDYVRNSPVFFAQNVKTPLFIFHCDKDGSVDFNQGVEYFNVLRRLQKPVFILNYEGERHTLRKLANQMDYSVRAQEFFDHYLMGKPAPKWLKEGIPFLEREARLKQRIKNYKIGKPVESKNKERGK
ncbi:MAG: prolyl oligopeptidase family serine peptidase [Candidatus Aminicenantes bacterium]|nr:MAG: prolyl oligopeptidase family serine peptidase [Candidatus Aminicenantes bacterium]